MNSASSPEFEFPFLEEGFSFRDTVEQKINESSRTVRVQCWFCLADTQTTPFVK